MWNRKNYKLGFDPWAPGLFLLIMLPNFAWFAFPASNDVLRNESITPMVDTIAQIFQILMVAALCAIRNVTRDRPMKRGHQTGVLLCLLLYIIGWRAYYAGPVMVTMVIFLLCLAPCGAFLIFALARKNGIALVSAAAFTVCHLIFAIVNFL